MGQRGTELAEQLTRVTDELIDAVEGCSAEQWRAQCGNETWSVGVTAHHVALAYPSIAKAVQTIAEGQTPPMPTSEQLDQWNADHAREYADVTQEDTATLLRGDKAAATEMLRGLTDEQLERTAPMAFAGGAPMSAAQMAERGLIGHPASHLASIKQAAGL